MRLSWGRLIPCLCETSGTRHPAKCRSFDSLSLAQDDIVRGVRALHPFAKNAKGWSIQRLAGPTARNIILDFLLKFRIIGHIGTESFESIQYLFSVVRAQAWKDFLFPSACNEAKPVYRGISTAEDGPVSNVMHIC